MICPICGRDHEQDDPTWLVIEQVTTTDWNNGGNQVGLAGVTWTGSAQGVPLSEEVLDAALATRGLSRPPRGNQGAGSANWTNVKITEHLTFDVAGEEIARSTSKEVRVDGAPVGAAARVATLKATNFGKGGQIQSVEKQPKRV